MSPIRFAVSSCVGLLLAVGARAGEPSAQDQRAGERSRPFVVALRVAKGPVLDGRLDDEVWSRAQEGGRLTQVDPVEGAEPTERTEFRVVYDDRALYFGVICYERDPSLILARHMERDARLSRDDSIAIALDTFLDRRNGYLFRTNANAAKEDFLIANNADLNSDWDGVWDVAATTDKDGWKVECEIPFTTLGFDPGSEIWGLNVERRIRRHTEKMRWAGARQQFRVNNVKEAGELRGLRGIKQGLGLEFVPFALGTFRDDRSRQATNVLGDVGGEMRYRITPNLTASLSYNTDFAQTEVDERQLNLTRFPLFFPEKRDFFLEDASIFRFGRVGRTRRFLGPGGRSPRGSEPFPFFSRRIGLGRDGEPRDIVVAGKLTGRVGQYNIGLVDALLDEHSGAPLQNTFVARVSRNIFEQSSIGAILTHGNPDSSDENFLAGGDINLRTSEFLGDQVLQSGFFALGTWTEGQADRDNLSFGGSVDFPNDRYNGSLRFFQADENFQPALGFVPRDGVRAYEGFFSFNPRPQSIEWIRQMFFAYRTSYFTDLEDDLETAEHEFSPLFIYFESGDIVSASVTYELDAPKDAFEISDGVFVTPGDYWWPTYKVGFETSSKRLLEFEFDYLFGEFYNGDRNGVEVEATLRSSRYLTVKAGYEINRIRLPQGDFDTRIASIDTHISFTPRLGWFHLVQYDNVSDSIGYQSRVHWEFRPGADVFVVLNQNVARNHGRARWLQSELALKVGASFRF